MSLFGPTRTSGDVRFGAAIGGHSGHQTRLIRAASTYQCTP
jgi:hypothetical protein